MQLTALKNSRIIFAHLAERQTDYLCPECFQTVRLRKGPHRKAHFYHACSTKICYQSQKTMLHLQAQSFFQNYFLGKAYLEYPFPTISRIADVYVPSQKLVFEIQCSPITSKEVKNRNADYKKLGISVIWILHDQRFNQKKLSLAEAYLRKRQSYFTNIDADGKGEFYDQIEWIRNNRRMHRGRIRPIHSFSKHTIKRFQQILVFFFLKKRNRNYLKGDLIDSFLKKDIPLLSFYRKIFSMRIQQWFFLCKNMYTKLLIYFLRREAS